MPFISAREAVPRGPRLYPFSSHNSYLASRPAFPRPVRPTALLLSDVCLASQWARCFSFLACCSGLSSAQVVSTHLSLLPFR